MTVYIDQNLMPGH